ncbi:hypothetical protein [Chromatium okenii]|uniref:hypothetical protein n=1 Tax=Chromatium okenii TaxID=61644 RepID=UPI001903C626|nr:hypothetical protein [Chromatium okenii]
MIEDTAPILTIILWWINYIIFGICSVLKTGIWLVSNTLNIKDYLAGGDLKR